MNKVTVFDVAQWFLAKESMTHKKLQKLIYYYYAWGQALLKRDVIDNCEFEAWVHGPVNRQVYSKYATYGWTPIEKGTSTPNVFTEEEVELLDSVWLTYGDKSANELSALTHQDLPWKQARGKCADGELCRTVLDKNIMRDYYISVYEEAQGE